MLTGCCLKLGLEKTRDLSRRRAALEAWQTALEYLAGELAFRIPDMPRLMEDLSHRAAFPPAETFAAARAGLDRLGERSFEELWRSALRDTAGPLAGEDREILERLGNILGRYGWEDQCRAVEAVRRELSDRAARLHARLDREGKVYGTLGLALGAFVSILLL